MDYTKPHCYIVEENDGFTVKHVVPKPVKGLRRLFCGAKAIAKPVDYRCATKEEAEALMRKLLGAD